MRAFGCPAWARTRDFSSKG